MTFSHSYVVKLWLHLKLSHQNLDISILLLFRLLNQNPDSCIVGRTQTILFFKTHTYLILIRFSLIISDIVLNL